MVEDFFISYNWCITENIFMDQIFVNGSYFNCFFMGNHSLEETKGIYSNLNDHFQGQITTLEFSLYKVQALPTEMRFS